MGRWLHGILVRDYFKGNLNDDYMGSMQVICVNRFSYMWNGDVYMQFLDCTAIEIRRKRIEFGIEGARQSPVFVFCDRCPSHLSQLFWAKENVVVFWILIYFMKCRS